MMNEINEMLMALDEMGFIVERVMDELSKSLIKMKI